MERSFFDVFSELEDPRNDKNKKYPLMDIIILAVYGTLIGFEDFTEYSDAAEPPVQCGVSHHSAGSEPPEILCRERLFT